MIVFRYLSRQLLQAMAAVTLVLLVVALTGRFIQYLGQAVAGELATDALFLLIIFRLPDFLLVIVPLAFFLSILLVYGRMYAENEMVVLIASGFSERKLVRMSLGFAALVMFLVGSLSLVLAPWGVRKTEELLQAQKNLTEVDLIVAGQFQSFGGGARVTHMPNGCPPPMRGSGSCKACLSQRAPMLPREYSLPSAHDPLSNPMVRGLCS